MSGGSSIVHSAAWEELTEKEVVYLVRLGNKEAFGELVRRHRSQIYSWASNMTRDPHLADDIVQDALVDAYLQIGSLMDDSRFGSWLGTIVRNRALMRLRRGGIYRHEQPLSGSKTLEAYSGKLHDDSAAIVMYKELINGITDKFACLSKRERAVLEAITLRQLTPEEIARQLGMTRINVYNCISRARMKLKQEVLRAHIQAHKRRRQALNLPNRQVLHVGRIFF